MYTGIGGSSSQDTLVEIDFFSGNSQDRCYSWITLDLDICLVPSVGPLQSGHAWVDIVTRELVGEPVKLPCYNKKPARFRTLSPWSSPSSCKRAVSNGINAVTKFTSY